MRKPRLWIVNLTLVLAVVAVFIIAFAIGSKKEAPEGEGFGGTDSVATKVVEASGYEPWFKSLFEPSSGEVESGLFALQAGIGGMVLGFALGALSQKYRHRKETAAAISDTGSSGPPAT